MATNTPALTGLEKASVLMMSLGAEASARVFQQLTEEEREIIGAQIVKLRHVDELTRRGVIDEVRSRFERQHPLVTTVAETTGPEPLSWLGDLDSSDIVELLAGERPSSIALVLSSLSPKVAANVLMCFDERLRNQVAHQLATMEEANPNAVRALDEALRLRRFGGRSVKQRSEEQAPEALLRILGNATARVRSSILSALSRRNPIVAEQVKRLVLSPESLTVMSDSAIREVISELDYVGLRAVLSVASEELREAVLRNVSPSSAEALRKELAGPIHVKLGEIEEAQQRLVAAMGHLEEKGKLVGVRSREAVVE
jgi:flagellar motor switch protein FliG